MASTHSVLIPKVSTSRDYSIDVRFSPESGHQSDITRCPLSAKSRHRPLCRPQQTATRFFGWWNLASLVEVAYWASCRICALENANSTKSSPRRIRPTGLGSLTVSRFRQSLLRLQAKMQLNCGFWSRREPTLRPGRILSADPNYRMNDQAHNPRRSKRSMSAKCHKRTSEFIDNVPRGSARIC